MKNRWTHRKWHSLTQLKNAIQESGEEKVVNFCGHTLVTDQYVYMLGSDRLYVRDLPDDPFPIKNQSTKKKAPKKKAPKKQKKP